LRASVHPFPVALSLLAAAGEAPVGARAIPNRGELLLLSTEAAPLWLAGRRHPGLAFDAAEKVRSGGDAAKNGADMPFGGNARGNRARALAEHGSEALFGLENANAMVAHREMALVGKPGSGLEKPAVQREKDIGGGAKMPGAGGSELPGRWSVWREPYRPAIDRQFNMLKPVRSRRNDAHVLGEMLQGKGLNGNGGAVGIDNDGAEAADSVADSFAVMIQHAVREVSEGTLAGIDYLDSCWATP
jgi:hypothetical protein